MHNLTTFLIFCVTLPITLPLSLYGQQPTRTVYLKVHGGVSSYLGDNNTTVFNGDVFEVKNKWPYSVGVEVGIQSNTRWQFGLGSVFADYPIITQFSDDLPVESHPTRRTSFQVVSHYALNARQLKPFLVFGMHLTLGQVSIFEASRLALHREPKVNKHYIWGPILGLGLDYFITPGFSVVTQFVTNVTFVDDAADGRLPLGPPLPTNLNVKDRFAPFDLLSGLSIGVAIRPGCFNGCDKHALLGRDDDFQEMSGKIRINKMLGNGLTTLSYFFSPWESNTLFAGITTGLGPRSITAQFIHPDEGIENDFIPFTDAFAGASLHYFGRRASNQRITPHAGILAAIPRQAQFSVGLDYHQNEYFSLGLEARYVLCPNREQTFYMNEIIHVMNSACEYRFGIGLTTGFTL